MSKRVRINDPLNKEPDNDADNPNVLPDVIALLEGSPNATIMPAGQNITEHDLDLETIQQVIKHLHDHWCSPATDGHIDIVAAERFGVLEQFQRDELVPYGDGGLRKLMQKKELSLLRTRYHAVRLGIMDLEEADIAGAASKAMLGRTHECLQRLYDSLMTSLLTRKCLDPLWASDCPTGEDPYYIRAFDINKLNANQQFLVFVLEQAHKMGLRRYRGACYIEIESPPFLVNGKTRTYKTHAWRKFTEIAEFVNRCAPKETHLTMWRTAVDGPAKNRAIEQLQKSYDMQFPDLVPDRQYHSFHNGLYDTLNKSFYPWGHASISSNMVSCKYHDKAFDEAIMQYEDWRDIPTPHFDKILSVQMSHIVHVEMGPGNVPLKWTKATASAENKRLKQVYEDQCSEARKSCWTPEEIAASIKCDTVAPDTIIQNNEGHLVMEWAYVFGGRLLYPVNYIDTWQVMPMFVGRAGTGKSLILSTWSRFFEDADIATIANDIQMGFGLETVWDKFLWMIKEVKHDLKLDQAQLQSMITGEEMSIMRKGLPALQVVWRAPGVMAGNELANWTDNSGSMSRRLVLFYFLKKVKQSDPRLAKSLADELPALLHKSNMAYAEACARFGHCDLWGRNPEVSAEIAENPELESTYRGSRTILPSYFHANKSSLKQQTHLMENFLANPDELQMRDKTLQNSGMPFEVDKENLLSFKSLANAYFKKLDAKPFQWSKTDRYMATLEDYDLEVRKLTDVDRREGRHIYGGREYEKDTTWIFGVVPKEKD